MTRFFEDANNGRTVNLYHNDAPGSGQFIAGGSNAAPDTANFVLSDGDVLAIVNPNNNAARLTFIELDVVPEPTTFSLLSIGSILIIALRRRRSLKV